MPLKIVRELRLLAVFLALFSFATFCADPQGTRMTAVYSLEDDREPVVSLGGNWRFSPGDDATWARPAFDDSKWASSRAPAAGTSRATRI